MMIFGQNGWRSLVAGASRSRQRAHKNCGMRFAAGFDYLCLLFAGFDYCFYDLQLCLVLLLGILVSLLLFID